MGESQVISTGRARLLKEWDGPGVLLLASDRLTSAQLDFQARRYDFRDIEDLRRNFAPSLALTTIIDTRETGDFKDGYVLVAAPDWIQAMQALMGQWTPRTEQRAMESGMAAARLMGNDQGRRR